jgi:hypothetical protein
VIDVPVGHHVLVVVLHDGSRLPAKNVDITDLDTSIHPLRVHW